MAACRADSASPQIDQINVDNVAKLEKAWEFRTGVAYDFKQTPQMANGLVYICTAGNTLIAVDSDTGEEALAPRHARPMCPAALRTARPSPRTCRGVGYHEAPADLRRRMRQAHHHRHGGRPPDRGRRADRPPLRSRSASAARSTCVSGLGYSPLGNFMVTSTPLIAGDKVVVGGWVTDNQQIGNPSGVLRAYDAITGAVRLGVGHGQSGLSGPA